MIQFRSFRARLLVLILGLAGVSQLINVLVVASVHRRAALKDIRQEFDNTSVRFQESVLRQNELLTGSAEAISFNTGLVEALGQTLESGTLKSALESVGSRLKTRLVALINLEGTLLAETRTGPSAAAVYGPLFKAADASEQARATGFGVIDGQLYTLVVVPLRAPAVIDWVVIGFPLDQDFIDRLERGNDVEITLRQGPTTLATTVTAQDPTDFETSTVPLSTVTGAVIDIDLQYSRAMKLAPAIRLEHLLEGVGAGTLALAAILSLGVARSVSLPVQQLAAHTELIGRGDYETRLPEGRADELGRLAGAFNAMSTGLAERDRVRDLLDKNVSPEVAAQLMRDGAALGGEEREVTILFADLFGFTALSERQQPRELLNLLNRYLDRMSAEIERHGGVIDKFIGDEIMALFGAPVSQPDSADRALAAALSMQSALAKLNDEFASEGLPPLAAGIGINTSRVVAGNIGSHRRLNYSVIGDGVNVASRLQTLTRNPDYRASIVVSAATQKAANPGFQFRPLGTIPVKGRAESVEVFALEPA